MAEHLGGVGDVALERDSGEGGLDQPLGDVRVGGVEGAQVGVGLPLARTAL